MTDTATQPSTPTQTVTAREPLPLTLSLKDTRAQKPILYIDDPPPAHKLTIEVTNASGKKIVVNKPPNLELNTKTKKPKRAPKEDEWHLALTFRPGTLEQSCLRDGPLAASPWYLVHRKNPDDGTLSLELTYFGETGKALKQDQSLAWTLPHLCADPRGGARETLVQLKSAIPGLETAARGTATDGTGKYSPRVERLSVVNHTGARELPLHAGFVGGNTVLNDGRTANSLTLRLTNVSPDKTIRFHPESSDAPSKFLLSFDTGDQNAYWALGTPSQVKAVTVRQPAFLKAREPQAGESPEWILTWNGKQTELEPGKSFDLAMTIIVSSAPTGQTHLRLRYENLPGYWDGQITRVIEKSPLRASGRPGASHKAAKTDLHGNDPLSVTTAKGLSLAPANDDRNPLYLATFGDRNHALYNNHADVDGEGSWDGAKWNTNMGLQVRVGSGGSKKTALSIDQGAWVEIHKVLGFRQGNQRAWHMSTYPPGSKGLNFAETGVEDGRLYLAAGGNVGIGTTIPSTKLEVAGPVSAQGQIVAGNSDIYFTKTNHAHTGAGNVAGHAAIENASSHKTLMILGRKVGNERRVSVYDKLTVSGSLTVTGGVAAGSLSVTAGVTAGSLSVTGSVAAGSLKIGGSTIKEGIDFTSPGFGWRGGGLKIVGSATNGGGVLATGQKDVLCWKNDQVVIDGELRVRTLWVIEPTSLEGAVTIVAGGHTYMLREVKFENYGIPPRVAFDRGFSGLWAFKRKT